MCQAEEGPETVFWLQQIVLARTDERNRPLNRSIKIISGDTRLDQILLSSAVEGKGCHCRKGHVSKHEDGYFRMIGTGNEMNEHFKAGHIREGKFRDNAIDVLRSADV